jgi:hypothetical protein
MAAEIGDRQVLGWTALVLAAMPGLWLWTLLAGRVRRWLSASVAAQRTYQSQREQPERRPASQLRPVLPVKSGGVSARVIRTRVLLAPARATATFAGPAHRRAVAGEPESMAKEPAAHHQH